MRQKQDDQGAVEKAIRDIKPQASESGAKLIDLFHQWLRTHRLSPWGLILSSSINCSSAIGSLCSSSPGDVL